MGDLIFTIFDWVPETPRGYVRDMPSLPWSILSFSGDNCDRPKRRRVARAFVKAHADQMAHFAAAD